MSLLTVLKKNIKFLIFCFTIIQFQNKSLAQSASMGTDFCTTTTTACNSISGCVEHTISVSGIGILSTGNVLNAIQVSLGSPSCQGNLTTYDFTIIAPDGTVYQFIDNITSDATTGWVNTTFMDNPNLERIRNDFSSSLQDNYNPWSIGYYRPNYGAGFSSLNGINADGNWTFRVCESSTGNMISFNSACLSFGTPTITYDALGAPNDICENAYCIDNTSLVNADNIGTVGDPLYPGDLVDGCSWNSGNHQGSWFKFQPTGTSATITLSGLDGPITNYPFQPIVLENSLGDGCPTSVSDWVVPNGGCPDDETVNNLDYLTTNGGGSAAGSIYQNGIGFNTEFNLSGLTANKTYYLFVDGNTSSVGEEFVINLSTGGAGSGPNGAVSCSVLLGAELAQFNVQCHDGNPILYWETSTETNIDYFEIQFSTDGYHFQTIGSVGGNGTTNTSHYYTYEVYDRFKNEGYFRLKQVDFNGRFEYSSVRIANCQNDEPIVQFVNDQLVISNVEGILNCTIYDLSGRIVFQSDDITTFLASLSSAVYFVQIETRKGVFLTKAYKP